MNCMKYILFVNNVNLFPCEVLYNNEEYLPVYIKIKNTSDYHILTFY